MLENSKIIDNNQMVNDVSDESLLKVVTDGIKYRFKKDILVKPLDPIKVKRIMNIPVKTEEVDEEGQPIMEMKQEEVDVDSTFREGIVLALPTEAHCGDNLLVGSKVVYTNKYAIDFDLFKDSVLVKPYDVVAVIE